MKESEDEKTASQTPQVKGQTIEGEVREAKSAEETKEKIHS